MSKDVAVKTVRSPCVGICALDERDFCVGCLRSGMEISRWGVMNDTERQAVIDQLDARYESASKQ